METHAGKNSQSPYRIVIVMSKASLYIQKHQELQYYLSAKGWDAVISSADDIQPYERIVVNIYNNDQTLFWPAELLFLPGLEKDMHEYSILQCYIPMAANVPGGMTIALSDMITRINTKLALGAFGLLEEHHVLFYKHNILLQDEQVNAQFPVIHQCLLMASYLLLHFQEAFVHVITGHMSVQEAMKQMPLSKVYK